MFHRSSDRYVDLDNVEFALSLAFRVPRVAPEPIVDTRDGLIEPGKLQDFHDSLAKAQEKLGESFAALRDLLDTQFELFLHLCSELVKEHDETDALGEIVTLRVGHWACTAAHRSQRERLIGLLIRLRSGLMESLRRMPHEVDDGTPARATWSRTAEGHVVVKVDRLTCTITEDRLAWMFMQVASARGQEVTWTELLSRRLQFQADTERSPVAASVQESTFERYGRDIRERLFPFGDLWEQSKTGARWRGDEALPR